MLRDPQAPESLQEDSLTEVVGVFKSVITSLLRTSGRTMRRVILSKNDDEFRDIIKESLKKQLIGDKYKQFLGNMEHSKNNLKKKRPAVMDKIIKTLTGLNEERLKQIYQVVKIITGMNNEEEVDKGKLKTNNSDRTLSLDNVGLFTPSEKRSSQNDELSYIKELSSIYSFQDQNNELNNDNDLDKLFLLKKRNNSNFTNFENQKKINSNKTKKKANLNLNQLVTKTYEMSDKTSLFSYEDMKDSNNNSIPEMNPPKNKLTKINTQIQNKFNFNMISPNINQSHQGNITFIPEIPEQNPYTNNANNNIHIKNIQNYNNFLPSKEINNKQGNSNNSKMYPMMQHNQQCPKIMIDYDHSSNSDIDPLLVTSEMGKKKFIRKSNAHMGAIYNDNNHSMFPKEIMSMNNINNNISHNLASNIINPTMNSKISTPEAPLSHNKKPKQIFFPCEINAEDIYNLNSGSNTKGNNTANLNVGNYQSEDRDLFYIDNSSTPKISKSKKPMTNSNNNNYILQPTQSSNLFPNNNFLQSYPNNLYPFFSQTNTPKTSNSNGPFFTDMFFNPNYTNGNSFKQPISQRGDQLHSAVSHFSFLNAPGNNDSSSNGNNNPHCITLNSLNNGNKSKNNPKRK